MSIPIPKTAMVLAAGLGRRMLPLTENKPKPLIEVDGLPLIDHVLNRLAAQGVQRAVVNVHHFADQMRDHLARYDELEVIISDETETLLDSGGGIIKALPHLDEGPWLAVNSDLILMEREPSIPRLCQYFKPDQMDFLLLLASTAETTGFDGPGDFHRAANGALTWRGPGEKAAFMNTGTQIIGANIFADLTPDMQNGPWSIRPRWMQAAQDGRFFGLPIEGRALHVGTPGGRDLAECVLGKMKESD